MFPRVTRCSPDIIVHIILISPANLVLSYIWHVHVLGQ